MVETRIPILDVKVSTNLSIQGDKAMLSGHEDHKAIQTPLWRLEQAP